MLRRLKRITAGYDGLLSLAKRITRYIHIERKHPGTTSISIGLQCPILPSDARKKQESDDFISFGRKCAQAELR